MDWGEARAPEAGSKVPNDKDPDSDRKSKFRDISSPSLPTLGSWWKLVEQGVKWIDRQSRHSQSLSYICSMSCSDKMNKVPALAGSLPAPTALARAIVPCITESCGICRRDSLQFFLNNDDSDRDEVE